MTPAELDIALRCAIVFTIGIFIGFLIGYWRGYKDAYRKASAILEEDSQFLKAFAARVVGR